METNNSNHKQPEHSNSKRKYPRQDFEDRDIDVKAITKYTVALLIITVVIYIGTGLFYKYLEAQEHISDPISNPLYSQRAKTFPKPQLQFTPAEDLHEIKSLEEKILKEGTKEDKIYGTRMPMDQAIDKVVQKGFLSRPESDAQNWKDKANQMPSAASAGKNFERRLR